MSGELPVRTTSTAPVVGASAMTTSGAFTPDRVRPDLVTGPRPWPDPDAEDDDEPCCDGEGCAWCDQDYWRGLYRELHQAYEALMDVVRDAATALDGRPWAHDREIGRHLRAKVGEAEVRRAAVRRYE